MRYDYRKLQNGSDIRGVAMEGVAGEAVNLGQEETMRLTKGFVLWLSEKLQKAPQDLTVSVGHDSRLSAESLKSAILMALQEIGATVYDCGLASTPAMFMSTIFEDYRCDGAILTGTEDSTRRTSATSSTARSVRIWTITLTDPAARRMGVTRAQETTAVTSPHLKPEAKPAAYIKKT